MRITALALAVLIAACTNVGTGKDKKELKLPPLPVSVDAVGSQLKNKNYKVEDVGFIRTFMGREDSAVWSGGMNDTSKHFRDYTGKTKDFTLHFTNDSTVRIKDDSVSHEAMYTLEKDTSSFVMLKIRFEDPGMTSPFDNSPMVVTYTYKIRGIDDRMMYLETPMTYNRLNVVLLMKNQ